MRKLATRKSRVAEVALTHCCTRRANGKEHCAVMWPILWTAMRTYAPYVTFPVAFVVGAVGYHLEWFIRGTPNPREEEKSIVELREERKLQEQVGLDSTQVLSLKDKLEFTPKAALNRNRPEKS
ncbi:small integral membrane protein 12 isoform X1 [Scomber scombrus]|uniref:Small integral membrane protein 12 isoform X1 n=2 Tax=Scomber scombrus TaxID=13677 RepID=A0AAV1MT23_SCOSC